MWSALCDYLNKTFSQHTLILTSDSSSRDSNLLLEGRQQPIKWIGGVVVLTFQETTCFLGSATVKVCILERTQPPTGGHTHKCSPSSQWDDSYCPIKDTRSGRYLGLYYINALMVFSASYLHSSESCTFVRPYMVLMIKWKAAKCRYDLIFNRWRCWSNTQVCVFASSAHYKWC